MRTTSSSTVRHTDPIEPSDRPMVFISYRRDDTSDHARKLYDALRRWLSAEQLFMDITTIEAGADYLHVLNDALDRTDVLLVLIGPAWMAPTAAGGSRLDDPDDFVRAEIRAGLERDIRVIPVLLDGTAFPVTSALPDDIR